MRRPRCDEPRSLEHLGITNAEDPSGESGELIPCALR